MLALVAFAAYLVHVPLHLATEAHSYLPDGHPHVDGAVGHDHGPVTGVGTESHSDADGHSHHAAAEHDIRFTGKNELAKLVLGGPLDPVSVPGLDLSNLAPAAARPEPAVPPPAELPGTASPRAPPLG